jgi:hypothetical protein
MHQSRGMNGRDGEERRCVWQLSTLYSSEKPAAACALCFVADAVATLGTVPCMEKPINSRLVILRPFDFE